MKELNPFLLALAVILFGYVSVVHAAPYFRQEAGLVPLSDNTYYIGTTTPSNLRYNGVFNNLTVSGTCTGCGSGSLFAWTVQSYGVSTSTTLGFLNGFLSTASSTFTGGFLANLSTTTSATTTNFFSTTASSTNLFSTNFNLGIGTLGFATSTNHAFTLATTSQLFVSNFFRLATTTDVSGKNLAGLSIATSTVIRGGQFANTISSTTGATTYTIDWNTGNTQRIILTGNSNFIINATSSKPVDGGKYTLKLCQDSTGSRTITFITPGQLRWWNGTTTPSSAANTCTYIGMIYDDTYQVYSVVASSTGVLIR